MAHVIGKIAYHTGTSGTLTLAAGERMIGLWCIATGAAGTVSIDGGGDIPLIAGVPFAFALESRTEEWTGVALVFTNTASYFVKTKKKVGG